MKPIFLILFIFLDQTTKEYLDFIYVPNRAAIYSNKFSDPIFSLLSINYDLCFVNLILDHNDHYKQNKVIIAEKNFITNLKKAELIFIINHEIQHSLDNQSAQKFLQTKENMLIKKGYRLFPINEKFQEFDADVIGLVKTGKTNIKNAIKALRIQKIASHNYTSQYHSSQRYEYSVEIVKSMITGTLPQEIPDAWLDDTEQILDQEIKRLQLQKQKATIPQIPRTKM